jgi:O-antigen ligase
VSATLTRTPAVSRRAAARLPQGWVALLAISMLLASDYKFRARSVADALSGRPDIAVLLEIAVYGLVGCYLAVLLLSPGPRIAVTPLLFCFVAYGLTMAASVLYATFPMLAAVRGVQLLIVCALCVAIVRVAELRSMHLFAHAFLAVVAASIAAGVVSPYQALSPDEVGRWSWLYMHPVPAGAYLALGIVLCAGYFVRDAGPERLWPRPAYGALFAVFTVALVTTRTRGSSVAAMIGVAVVVFAQLSRRARRDALIAIVVVGAAVALLFSGPAIEYFDRGDSEAYIPSYESRANLWVDALEHWEQRPLTGYGLTAARGLFYEQVGLGGGHNAFVNVLVEGGITAVFWWLGALVLLGVECRRLFLDPRSRTDAPLLFALYVTLLCNSLTIDGIGAPANASVTWLAVLIGWVLAWKRIVGQRELPPRAARDLSPAAG